MSAKSESDPVARSGSDEREYLLRRAEYHRQRAEKSDEPDIRTIHLRFRQLYLERALRAPMVVRD